MDNLDIAMRHVMKVKNTLILDLARMGKDANHIRGILRLIDWGEETKQWARELDSIAERQGSV